MNGKRYYIKKNSNINKVILSGGGNNIDDAKSITLNSSVSKTYPSISVFSDGNQWYVENIDDEADYNYTTYSDSDDMEFIPNEGIRANIDSSSNNVILGLNRATSGLNDHILTKINGQNSVYISGEGNTINGSALMEITGSDPVTLSRDGDSWRSSSSSLSLPFGDNLIAYFPFKETSNTVNLVDLKDDNVMEPKQNNGNDLNVDGIVGSGYLRTSDNIRNYTARESFSENSTEWCVSFWYKAKRGLSTDTTYELLKNIDSQNNKHFSVSHRWNDNNLRINIYNDHIDDENERRLVWVGNADGYSPNSWNHVLLNYTGNQLDVYLNNDDEKKKTKSGNFNNPCSHIIKLFTSNAAGAQVYFDELYFLNRALTAHEIELLYSVKYGRLQ